MVATSLALTTVISVMLAMGRQKTDHVTVKDS